MSQLRHSTDPVDEVDGIRGRCRNGAVDSQTTQKTVPIKNGAKNSQQNDHSNNGIPEFTLVRGADASRLEHKIEELLTMLKCTNLAERSGSEYVEPGPCSPRKYFSAVELAERWGCGTTKTYNLARTGFPHLKSGQLIRNFWAHVWAYEGRIEMEEANQIFESRDGIQER